MKTDFTFLTTDELAIRIKYDAGTIRGSLKDSVLIEGVHYIKPFGGRKTLYVWERIQADMFKHSQATTTIPMASGGVINERY